MAPHCLNCAKTAMQTITPRSYNPFSYSPFSYDPPEPKPVLPKDTSTTPLVGYRVWNLDRKTCKLTSTFKKEFSWPFRKPLAKDGINDMGIHAMKSGKYILDAPSLDPAGIMGSTGLWDSYKAEVAGSVYLWGEVQEHTLGYLAEFAYPKELWMSENTDPLTIMELEWNYGVPVTLRADLKIPHKEDDSFSGLFKTYAQIISSSPFPKSLLTTP